MNEFIYILGRGVESSGKVIPKKNSLEFQSSKRILDPSVLCCLVLSVHFKIILVKV